MADSRRAQAKDLEEPADKTSRVILWLLLASILFAVGSGVYYFAGTPPRSPDPAIRVKARHILVRTSAEAEKVRKEAQGGAQFEDLAKKYSTDAGTKHKGGELGWFARGKMVPPFEKAAFEARVGEIIGPVQTIHGYHIIEVQERSDRDADGGR